MLFVYVSLFFRENPKIGNGQACKKKHGNDVLAVEVVIIVSHSELSDPSNLSCLKAFGPKTEVSFLQRMIFY